MQLTTMTRWSLLCAGLLCFAACDVTQSPTEAPPTQAKQATANVPEQTQRQMVFLNRIRQADPNQATISRALLNEQNELGLVLNRDVALDKIPALMRSVMTEMAQEFPGEDLTVIAYAPSTPPRKIGTAHLNAQTRDMVYTPEK